MHPLKKFLKIRNLTVKEFAKQIGITREHFHSILSGKKHPRPETATKIEQATNGEIKAEWLIFPEKYKKEIQDYVEENHLTGVEK